MNHNKGIHHITSLAGEPQRNVDFYLQTLGMRMVKKSVNQDDPGTYHLFYGNAAATPGSGLTFFPWPRAVKGETGTGEAVAVSFSVPLDSFEFWTNRLEDHDVSTGKPFRRFDFKVLPFEDPDGLTLELVFEDIDIPVESTWKGPVPAEHAIQGFWGTILRLTEEEETAGILEQILGFSKFGTDDNRTLYKSDARIGSSVIIETGEPEYGKNGRGSIHHVAFRAENEEELDRLRKEVNAAELSPTPIIDRHWFKSVYFRTPGGVLFEMATDGPGYDVDEDPDKLGQKLILPPWLESRREMIQQQLPEIKI